MKIRHLSLLVLVPLLLVNPAQKVFAAVDCDQESIAFYLEKGFTQEQITRLCTKPEQEELKPAEPLVVEEKSAPEKLPEQLPKMAAQVEDHAVYLQFAIAAQDIKITPDMISYQREECFEEGDNESMVFNDHACGIIHTEIKIPGMEVVRTVKGNFFIDQELIIKSDIKRKVLNTEELSNASVRILHRLMGMAPQEINIPLRDDFDPADVAERLKKL